MTRQQSDYLLLKDLCVALSCTAEDLTKNGYTSLTKQSQNVVITHLTHDSRQVTPGALYVALNGRRVNGISFVPQALAKGASVIIAPKVHRSQLQQMISTDITIPIIWIDHPRKRLGELSDLIYGSPSTKLKMVGVTGTNGKTSVCTLLASIIEQAEGHVGLFGTILNRIGGKSALSEMTTPEATSLHAAFSELVNAGVRTCIMEVSSIGLMEERVSAIQYNYAVFLNLSEDHLDYHKTMEQYGIAKLRLFTERLDPNALVIVNREDPFSDNILAVLNQQTHRVWTLDLSWTPDSKQDPPSIWWSTLNLHSQGIHGVLETPYGSLHLTAPLIGRFNALNLAAAVGVALNLGCSKALIENCAKTISIPGRMQLIPNDKDVTVIVDYAHSPDALTRAIQALRPICNQQNKSGKLWVLFGCGGDRDKEKRPLMGQAMKDADGVILTSDNPRGEPPEQIALDALQGLYQVGIFEVNYPHRGGVWVELDRSSAIQGAINALSSGDVLLIAGKGHERYQERMNQRYPFDDVEEARKALKNVYLDNLRHLDSTQAEPILSTRQLCVATGGTLTSGMHRALSGIEIDTRRLSKGGAFFCLQGTRDGHEFIDVAIERGAGAIIVKQTWWSTLSVDTIEGFGPLCVITVTSPKEALAEYAAYHRKTWFHGTCIGLTGSNGKTSTKELLSSALLQAGPTLSTMGNFNNELGVPLTLFRLRPRHKFAVIEMGMNALGEIAQLSRWVRPDIGLITSIGAAHLEGLGTIQRVAQAKGELFHSLSSHGLALYLDDLNQQSIALDGVLATQYKLDSRLTNIKIEADHSSADLTLTQAELNHLESNMDQSTNHQVNISIPFSGSHQLKNARLALGTAIICGVPLKSAIKGLKVAAPPKLRGELHSLKGGGQIWLDCYNANPPSTIASVQAYFQSGAKGPLIIGALKELGTHSELLHKQLGEELVKLAPAQTPIFTIGDEATVLSDTVRRLGGVSGGHFHSDQISDLAKALEPYCTDGYSIFIKGSRSGRLERLLIHLSTFIEQE